MPNLPAPTADGTEGASAHEALIQFLYKAPIGLLQTREDGEVLLVNPMAAQLLMPLAPGGDLSNLFDVLQALAPELRALPLAPAPGDGVLCDGLQLALPATGTSGQASPRTLSLNLLKMADGTLMASLSDVTLAVQQEHQRLATQIRDVSRTDALTTLPNRAVVLERIDRALVGAAAEPGGHLAVLFINADRFNWVNVTHGHAAGDQLLRQLAGRLNGVVRASDAVGRADDGGHTAARLSGDEFVVLLDGLRRTADVHRVAQRLLDALSQPYDLDGHQVHVGISMGVVLLAQATGDADSVLEDAGLAMREAKRAGGGRYEVFEPRMKENAARRGSLEAELRTAIAEHQLFVVYQPIINLRSGHCDGFEALVRWRHPVRGVVPPMEFIPIAEESGLIRELGTFVLNEACQQHMAWQAGAGRGDLVVMSVNLSRAQLADPLLVQQVSHALQASGMPAAQLQLEVTESLAAQDEQAQARLHELKALGLLLALDDFGTGYSSLACLHLLPVEVVKVDRSFVSQVEQSAHHKVLIEATVRVAQSLGMRTVAEGIETPGQSAMLAQLQCDKGQGYFYGRPMTVDDATAWLVQRMAAAANTTEG
jgi:diguanylate cyclase (GGDEF)-like protein